MWLDFSGEINGYKIVREPDFIGYTVHPLELTEGDRQQLMMNSAYIPKPNMATHRAFNFRFPLTSSIKSDTLKLYLSRNNYSSYFNLDLLGL